MAKIFWNCDTYMISENHICGGQIDTVQLAVPIVFERGQKMGGGHASRYACLNDNIRSRRARDLIYEPAQHRVACHYHAASDAGVLVERRLTYECK